jgi:ribulose-5-phosphate 4-epimerase/fuculose-1-phosphate aldolase
MTDLVFTHITAKLPGSNAFLINPYGLLFDEITASSLVKVDDKCNKLQVGPPSPVPSEVNINGGSMAETPLLDPLKTLLAFSCKSLLISSLNRLHRVA